MRHIIFFIPNLNTHVVTFVAHLFKTLLVASFSNLCVSYRAKVFSQTWSSKALYREEACTVFSRV